MSRKRFNSVWDAIEDGSVKREIYKLRSKPIHMITEHIKANHLKQREVAELSGISQPRISTLMKGEFESFRSQGASTGGPDGNGCSVDEPRHAGQ